jgi:peroxiredoxin
LISPFASTTFPNDHASADLRPAVNPLTPSLAPTMALTPSNMLPLGTPAPDFALPDTEGRIVSLADFETAPLLAVLFLCNHCPYVKHVRAGLIEFANDYAARGVRVVGINSNDAEAYPADAPDKMAAEGYPFPYLFDATQEIARAYDAACTPDLYLFDQARRLAYRGQFDDSRPGNGRPVTGADFRAACDALLAGRPVPSTQTPSIGCNIKWRQS